MIFALELVLLSVFLNEVLPAATPNQLVLAGELIRSCYTWYNMTSKLTGVTTGSLMWKCPMEIVAPMFNSRHPESRLLKLLVCDEHHYSLTVSILQVR